MALVTSAHILLVTSSYVTMPNIKGCVEVPLGPGTEEALGILVSVNNVSPTSTYVFFIKDWRQHQSLLLQFSYSPV